MAASYQARRSALKRFLASVLIIPSTLPGCASQLGFLGDQQKDVTPAKEGFPTHLALKPDAPDAKLIKEYLIELDRSCQRWR